MHILIILGLFIETQSYVLLQVRKQNNNYSNVDALIHKVIPSDKVHEIASKFGAKQLTEPKLETKQDTKGDREIDNMKRDAEIKKTDGDKRNTDIKKRVAANRKRDHGAKEENDFVANIEKTILNFVKKDQPRFRSQDRYIKPKVINFRNSKPTVVFQIDSKAIVRTINHLLSSKTFQGYMEKFARKAGVVYRTMKQEIDKDY